MTRVGSQRHNQKTNKAIGWLHWRQVSAPCICIHEYGSYHGMSRRIHSLSAIKLPCSGTRRKVQGMCSLRRLEDVWANKHFYVSRHKHILSVTSIEYQKVFAPQTNREQCVKWSFGSLCGEWVICHAVTMKKPFRAREKKRNHQHIKEPDWCLYRFLTIYDTLLFSMLNILCAARMLK